MSTRHSTSNGRRGFIAGVGGTLVCAGLTGAGLPAAAQNDDLVARVRKPRILGDPDAAVHVAEYFSLTCMHCARFHKNTFPEIREKLINEGHIRYELRPFPLDGIAARAHTLARAVPEKRYFAMIDLMLSRQSQWAFSREPIESLRKLMMLAAGMGRREFSAIIGNRALQEIVIEMRTEAARKWSVSSTPSFVIDDKKLIKGGRNYAAFVQEIGGIGT